MSDSEKRLRKNKYQKEWQKKNADKWKSIHAKASKKYNLKNAKKNHDRYESHKISIRARQRLYYESHKLNIKKTVKQWVMENKEKRSSYVRDWRLRKEYGISLEIFNALVADQNGLCAICHIHKATHCDHDHETGTVRGVLCSRCNTAIGLLRENSEIVLNAAEYLEYWGR